jgi:hypothetical protein
MAVATTVAAMRVASDEQGEGGKAMETAPPPKNVERVINEYVDCKKGTIFLQLTTW